MTVVHEPEDLSAVYFLLSRKLTMDIIDIKFDGTDYRLEIRDENVITTIHLSVEQLVDLRFASEHALLTGQARIEDGVLVNA